ncbi:sodium-independent anion transporter [Pseudonocardia sulfidoxydans NBRC 16205]|uniref:Sodium-independent anion transporter n=1 Tax=Pseudonocardia sulfidoxydans NBRC 16205 TaxID=1223511 RepID=A0A511D8F7_9PSEU|nr:SulP family inorganic anion transporter [Pseudonocardia sulfidoxydans]GEL21079.1 sodium-independent anion transporter [Pseudonocardia sulfidoxydans NBRC 16205]
MAVLKGWAAVSPRRDVLAGLTVWAVLVPESLAYATIAGVSPVVGLYAAVPSLLIYALLGSSRHLVVAPMSATAALSAGTVALFAGGDAARYVALTTALAVVAGLVALLAGLLRLGFLSTFISEPVLKGFIIGLALTIIVGQVPALLGVDKGEGEFFGEAWHVLTELSTVNWPTAAVGLGSLAVVLVLRRTLPLVPGSLVVVALGIVAVAVLHLTDHGVEIVGPIESGLPALGLPDVGISDYLDLAGPAAGVVLVGFAEGLGAAKTYAARRGYTIDPNTELIGLGGANLGAGLASGMVVNGSLSKTAVNGGAGARSQLSGVVVAALTVVTLLLLTGLFEQLPEATLAAVVIAAVIELVDLAALRRFRAVWTTRLGRIYRGAARADFLAALATLVGVLLFDTLPGLLIGVVASMVLLLQHASRPNVPRLRRDSAGSWVDATGRADGEEDADIAVVRIEGGLFFANADHVRQQLLAAAGTGVHTVVIAGETIPTVDLTGAAMLEETATRLREEDVALVLAHPIGQVRDVLQTAGAQALLVVDTVDHAIALARPEHPARPATGERPSPSAEPSDES